ncbi:MAG TPA: DUF2834 domain-containing protein [Chitinophagales bacterium]|nr:DUF2834 domain-containing protein [Chitinophagales bacterium]
MKNIYLALSVAGFIAPNIFVLSESIDTGNILLWLNPAATIYGMFSNRIATAFIVDLLFGVLVFFVWSYNEARRTGIKNVWLIWALTMLFGLGGTFPLFLYLRERKMKK